MQIIFNRQVADELSEKYTVLELEQHDVEGKILETWCVVPSDKIPLDELTLNEHWKKLHGEFVQANKDKNGKLCRDLAEYLVGKWGGELDEFYEIVCSRFELNEDSQ
ncbi:hypothetical protein UFOVP257_180 [uncultured Caudovirales phage]|uniref:Uncharacterized protein n=1 Tax=uncultured Caudovirales phage TaxID=2100421 RepID=A0A6J5LJB0_9CAUD|nr:hypothetical protein UFOVP257_180 [uncultured Caudovirales phage]